MTPYERSVRRWMNAYPRRWRVTYGDDLVATARELAGPDRTRLGLREGLALVRGGWALRRRERPRWRVRAAVAWGMGVPPEVRRTHRAWLVDHALSPWERLPTKLAFFVPLGAMQMWNALSLWQGSRPLAWFVGGAAVFCVVAPLVLCVVPRLSRREGRQVWAVCFPGEPVPPELESPARRAARPRAS